MAQFIAELPSVEVSHTSINSFLNCMRRGRELRLELLEKYHLLEEKEWYPLQYWLDAFKEISHRLGDMNLFLTGIALVNRMQLPPLNNLYEALKQINISYHMKHRINGQIMYDINTHQIVVGIGNYSVLSYSEEKQEAIVICDTPYPSKFEEGVLYELTRKFKPNPNRIHLIKQDTTKERRTKGGKSCTYIITW